MINVVKIEFLKDVSEHRISKKDEYYMFNDNKFCVAILRTYLG